VNCKGHEGSSYGLVEGNAQAFAWKEYGRNEENHKITHSG
jgi:hypothetical protein